MSKGNVKVALYTNRNLKMKLSKLARFYIERYINKYKRLDINHFNAKFNPIDGAKRLYKGFAKENLGKSFTKEDMKSLYKGFTEEDMKEFNPNGLTENDFLYVLAYVFDRSIPYYLYKTQEEMNHRKPKPLKNWSHYIFPKDKVGGIASKYQYKIDENVVLKLVNKQQKDVVWGNEYTLNRYTYSIAKPTKQSGNFMALTSKYSAKQILNFMATHNYNEVDFATLMGNTKRIVELDKRFISEEYLHTIKTYRGGKTDPRTNLEYNQDLVAGWIYEDMFYDFTQSNFKEVKIFYNGNDQNREILGHRITHKADFLVEYKGIRAPLEYVVSHSEYTYRTGSLNLRLNKVLKVQQQKAMLLNVETYSYENKSSPYVDKTKEPKFILLYGDDFNHRTAKVLPQYIDSNGTSKEKTDGYALPLFRGAFQPMCQLESQIMFVFRQHYL